MASGVSFAPPGFRTKKTTSDSNPRFQPTTSPSVDTWSSLDSPFTYSMVLFRPFGPEVTLSECQQRMELMAFDLHRLLRLETREFWDVIKSELSILKSIDSFLRFTPRHWFEYERLPEDRDYLDSLSTLNRLVFLVLLRLATNKDVMNTKDAQVYLQAPQFGQLIYHYRVWRIPMIFDVIAVFGKKNEAVLRKMIESLFNCQPKFRDDLGAALSSTELALRQMASQLEQLSFKKVQYDKNLLSQLSDMVVFAYDAFTTMENIFKLYPESSTIVEEFCPTLPAYCAEFADSTLQTMVNHLSNLSNIEGDCKQLSSECLLGIAAATEIRTVQAFKAILSSSCLRVPDQMNPEQYFSTLTTVIGHNRFLWLLDTLHSIADDIRTLEKNCGQGVDSSCRDYVLSAIHGATKQFHNSVTKQSSAEIPATATADIAAGGPSKPEIDEMIQSVCNIMGPDLDKKFMAKCLKRFDYSVEALVQAMLDDNLPPDLRDEQHTAETSNTTDHVEVALASIHIGKRETSLDSSELKEMKSFYNKYSTEVFSPKAEVEPTNFGAKSQIRVNDLEYDDEYDDTYDDNEVPVGPQGSAGDEILRRRAFTVPRILAIGTDRVTETTGDEEDDEEEQKDINVQPAPLQQYSGRGRGRGRNQPPPQQPEQNIGPRPGDTRGFKGAQRQRQKIARGEIGQYSAGGQGRNNQHNRQKNSGNRNEGRGENTNESGEIEQREEHSERNREQLPESVQRMRKERHKGSSGNHNRRDLAARKRREF